MKNFIDTYVHPKGWRGWLHVVIVAVLAIALIRSCTKEYRYEKKLEELSKVKPVEKTGTTQGWPDYNDVQRGRTDHKINRGQYESGLDSKDSRNRS